MPQYVLGLDGGGTKTVAAVADNNGCVLSVARGGASTLQNEGAKSTTAVMRFVITEALEKAGLSVGQLSRCTLGLGGLDTKKDAETYAAIVGTLLPLERTRMENDAFIGLYSGTNGAPGIVTVAGTGSIIAAIDHQGRRYRRGGWGYLLNDQGSAAAIGRRALQQALDAEGGWIRPTALVEAFKERFGHSAVFDLLSLAYAAPSPYALLAELAPLVSALAEQGDGVAREVVETEADQLARAVRDVAARFGGSLAVLPVVLVGSVFQSAIFRTRFEQTARGSDLDLDLRTPCCPPVGGALFWAIQDLDGTVKPEVVESISQGLNHLLSTASLPLHGEVAS